MIKSYVYIMLEVDKDGGERHKIGITKNNPSERLKNLKTGNSNEVRVLRFYESENYKKIEPWLHRKYHSKKTLANNEWFQLDNSDVENFISICNEIDTTIEILNKENPFYNS